MFYYAPQLIYNEIVNGGKIILSNVGVSNKTKYIIRIATIKNNVNVVRLSSVLNSILG